MFESLKPESLLASGLAGAAGDPCIPESAAKRQAVTFSEHPDCRAPLCDCSPGSAAFPASSTSSAAQVHFSRLHCVSTHLPVHPAVRGLTCISAHLRVCLSVSPPTCLSAHLCLRTPVCLLVCVSAHLPVHSPASPPTCVSAHLRVCSPASLPTCISAHLFLCPPVHPLTCVSIHPPPCYITLSSTVVLVARATGICSHPAVASPRLSPLLSLSLLVLTWSRCSG